MSESQGGHSAHTDQQPLDASQEGQAGNIIDEENSVYVTKRADRDVGANMEASSEAIKDRVDDAIPKGPKKADASTGGRVMVGETGDLLELAAKRQP